jgi:hypothetical protein
MGFTGSFNAKGKTPEGVPPYGSTFDRMFLMTGESLTVVPETGISVSADTDMSLLYNTDKDLIKIYGHVKLEGTMPAGTKVKIATIATGIADTDTAFDILATTGMLKQSDGWHPEIVVPMYLRMQTNGDVDLYYSAGSGYTGVMATFPACLYINKDFGD